MHALCIIPARGGSKRIPRKNLRPLGGKPLLTYTVKPVLASRSFEEVVVSSDDAEILELAGSLGARPDARPIGLAGDTTKAVEVVLEFIKRPENEGRFDVVAMCLPTCPFRTTEDVRAAMALFERECARCPRLVGVTPCEFPPQLALFQEGSDFLDMREPEAYGFSTRSQDLGRLYYPNGAIYVATIEEFLRAKTFFGRPMLKYEMPPERSFDIDYEYQFQIAECITRAIAEMENNEE